MKLVLALAFISYGAFAGVPVNCNPRTVGKTCFVGNGQRHITGSCVWLENHFLPSCLITDCGRNPRQTLNLNCQKSESEIGNCTRVRGFVLPQCE